MSIDLRFRPEFESDVQEAAQWYEARARGLGERFSQEVRAALHQVAEQPEAWTQIAPGVRRAKLRIFPYVLIFRLHPEFAEIVAVVHGARHPRIWRARTGGA